VAGTIERLQELKDSLAGLPLLEQACRLAGPDRLFLVGGVLRDALLGRRPARPLEVDLALAGDSLGLSRELAGLSGASRVVLSESERTVRLVLPELILDLTSFRGPDLESDLRGRDFTVNALAVSLEGFLTGHSGLIDPSGGLEDLQARRMRPAGPGVLAADPLRVLRGFRLAAQLGLNLPRTTRLALAAAAPGLKRVAGERLGQELSRLLLTPRAAGFVALMAEDKILGPLLPEVAGLAGVYQNRFHHLDALGHTISSLAEAESLLAQGPGMAGRPDPAVVATQPERLLSLKLALLFHDTGKRERQRPRADGQLSFPGHEGASHRLWLEAGARLRLSRSLTAAAARLIKAHMRPFSLLVAPCLSPRALRRLILAVDGQLDELGLLCLADCLATRGPASDPAGAERLGGLWGRLIEVEVEMKRQAEAPLVRGDRLMAALGLAPGPLVGRLLAEIAEQRLAGRVGDEPAALDWAAGRLDQLRSRIPGITGLAGGGLTGKR